MAPREQTEVPMLFWASPGFYAARAQVDPLCLRRAAEERTSHDAVFHTLLPLFGLRSPLYDERLDLMAACRGPVTSALGSR
jgi:lipid A ethanolaminephosphotransferase